MKVDDASREPDEGFEDDDENKNESDEGVSVSPPYPPRRRRGPARSG